LSTDVEIEPVVLKEIPPLIMRIHSTMYDYKLKTVQYEKKDLARPQHRIVMALVTDSHIGNVPNFSYMSNMTIYFRISTLKAGRLIFSPIYF
jgi:hypothetical protein